MLLGMGILLSANEVPRIAQQFGLDSSVKVNMMSVACPVLDGLPNLICRLMNCFLTAVLQAATVRFKPLAAAVLGAVYI